MTAGPRFTPMRPGQGTLSKQQQSIIFLIPSKIIVGQIAFGKICYCFFHAIIFHPSRTQLELASACEKGLRFVHEKLVGANLLQPQVVLGLRIAARWVKLVIEKDHAWLCGSVSGSN